jgi:hypothetical protein
MEHLTIVAPKSRNLKKLKKIRAHDNVPCIVPRTIFEGNIPVKNQKNFPMFSRKDAVKELSQRHLHSKKFSSSNQEP